MFGEVVGDDGLATVHLTEAATRVAHLDTFVWRLREDALPWFLRMRDPDRFTVDRPAATFRLYVTDLAEWLVMRGDRDRAAELFRTWLARDPARRESFDAGLELAASGGRPQFVSPLDVGWSAGKLGLAR
jgi:hypothetical protein